MARVIVHIDLNAFFVRAEEIKDPSLENKPVAIGHEGRGGIVSTCSYEARKYGVSSGMPMFKAKQLCPDLIIKPGDYRFYSALSAQFMDFVKSYTKVVEIASIDECFADFTEIVKGQKDVITYFRSMQEELYAKTKLKCSIGVAPTKFLAKMGSDFRKPMGLTIIRKKDIEKILYPLSIDKMFGIGKKTSPELKKIGINTIGDFALRANKNDNELMNIMGKSFYLLKDWVNGLGSDIVETSFDDPKSIGTSTTLAHDTSDLYEIRKVLNTLCENVASRAIKERQLGWTIQVTIKDNQFETKNKSITLNNPTNKAADIYDNAVKLYEKNFINIVVRLIGVTLQKLVSVENAAIQMTLFDYEEHEKENETKLLINDLNRRLKKPNLMRASEVKKNANK